MTDFGYDDVNGTVIGGFAVRYEFWQKNKQWGWWEKIADGTFESDDEAISWFKEKYPGEYKTGVEMRVFDQPKARLK